MMLVCLPVYRRAALWPVWWHWAQSAGTLRENVGDAESFLARGWRGLWQSCQVGIGVAALAVFVRHALGVGELAHFVRLVAIHAGRNHVRRGFPELAVDHFTVHGFNLAVALPA